MPCIRSGDSIICIRNVDFEFRFLLWKCEFTDRMCAGPYWSYPMIRFDFKYFKKRFKYDNIFKLLILCFEVYEKDFYPGDHNPLWKIFNIHYRRWSCRK